MEPSSLKLLMLQGPRAGETLEFRPGSTIRIGRIVRGNNVTIKDDGVSSKHLIIAPTATGSNKWTLQDLDSSNGTALNDSPLPPFQPFDLHDGDTLKLGAYTSIRVQIIAVPAEEEEGLKPRLRRNPRRKVKEPSALEPVAEDPKEREEEVIVEKARRGRRGRPRKARVSEDAARGCNEQTERMGVNARDTTRSRRNLQEEESSALENLDKKTGRGRGRGRGKGKELQEMPLENGDGKAEVFKVKEEIIEIWDSEEKFNDLAADGEKEESGSKEKGSGSRNLCKEDEEEEFDFEKKTLGEWFDYMEVELPKQIIEETEKLIEGMRERAERVKEYMMEYKQNKGVSSVG